MINSINILGTGGAFDIEEGNSSFVINCNNKNHLVDCGYDVFPKLIRYGLADKIDYICVSHNHSDHIGSLSDYLYYLYFVLKKKVPIITSIDVEESLQTVLWHMGMKYSEHYHFVKSRDISIINTNGLHCPNMKSCGFIFDKKLIISGDTGVNILNHVRGIKKLLENGAIVFHDATTLDTPVHCKVDEFKDSAYLKQIYFYHHSYAQRKIMSSNGYNTLSPTYFEGLTLNMNFGL